MAEWALQKTKLCKFYAKGRCTRDECGYAHSLAELRDVPKRLWKNATAPLDSEQLELRDYYQENEQRELEEEEEPKEKQYKHTGGGAGSAA